jgi:hypothetical protein
VIGRARIGGRFPGAAPSRREEQAEGRIHRKQVDAALSGRDREEDEERDAGQKESPCPRRSIAHVRGSRRRPREREKQQPGKQTDGKPAEVVVPGRDVVPRRDVARHVLLEQDLRHVGRARDRADRRDPRTDWEPRTPRSPR